MLRNGLKSWLGSWQEWAITIPLFIALEIAVGSIEQAHWITPHPSLTVVLVLATVTGWLLCKSRLPGLVSYPLAVVLGAAVTTWQASNLEDFPEITSRVGRLVLDLQSWWLAISAGKPAEGTIHFAVFLIFLTWLIGCISALFVLKRQNAWVGVSLGAIAIVINLANLSEKQYSAFFLYLLAALISVGAANLAKHFYRLKKIGAVYPRRGVIYFVTSLVCLTLLAVSVAWLTPDLRVERFENLIGTKSLWPKSLEKRFGDFLASVPAKQPFLRSDANRSLLFGDSSFDQGDELQFVVLSERPSYWRTRTYDTYVSSGWTSSNASEQMHEQAFNAPADEEIAKRQEMTYTVIPEVKTDILLTGGEFISSSIPVSVQMLAPRNFSIDLVNPPLDGYLPPDMVSLARTLKAARQANKDISLEQLVRLLPDDLTLAESGISPGSQGETESAAESTPATGQLTSLEVTRRQPVNDAVVSVASLYLLRPDRRYTVTSSISLAAAEDLSRTGAEYPRRVTDYYRQLPPLLPGRIRELSESVTKGAKTNHDKALAIKGHLSQIAYHVEGAVPPQGVDGVDYFLFTSKSGNCVQFASAMTVMLRSIGIPARVAIGYTPGEWDAASRRTILTARERHAWSEAFFPGYGWVGFEATPGANGEPVAAADAGGSSGNQTAGASDDLSAQDTGSGINAGTGTLTTASPDRGRQTLLIAIGATILLAFVLWFVISRRRKSLLAPDHASEVYRKMCLMASFSKLGPEPWQTPFEYQAKLASVFPLQAEELGDIVQTYVEGRYSLRKELGQWQRFRLLQSWLAVRPQLIRRLLRWRH